jgi:Domain of unknown function (DUF4340)
LTAPVAEIEERGPGTNRFLLQRKGSNDWAIVGKTFPVDAASVQQFIEALAGLHIADFVRGVVTAQDLPAYGLDAPRCEIILRSKTDDTNAVIADLLFGATQTNKVFVRRADEDSVYAVSMEDFNTLFGESGLFAAAWQFRDRRVWDFNVNNVARVTIHQNGKTRQLVHDGANQWSLGAGSQGIVDGQSIERAVEAISLLDAVGWVRHQVSPTEGAEEFGLSSTNLQISIELKNSRTFTVDFGLPISDGSALAAVTLDGDRWVFVAPVAFYQMALNYLTIPANVP